MDKTQREDSLVQILEAFTKGLTTLKEAIALVHSAQTSNYCRQANHEKPFNKKMKKWNGRSRLDMQQWGNPWDFNSVTDT